MKITKEWLESKLACKEGYKWALKQKGIDNGIDVYKFINLLVKDDKWDWANWVIVRVMTRKQYLNYAIYSAEQVIDIYENKYPNNKAPREAIEAAKTGLENNTQANHDIAITKRRAAAANAAAYAAAYDYADAANAAYAAYAAANAAAYAAAYAYTDAAYAAYAAAAAKIKTRMKILKYGINLLRKEGIEI